LRRVSTGLKKLDELLGGGFPGETVILVSGSAGTGKTLLGLNFVAEGARKGENSCYLSLNENKAELLRACEGIAALEDAKKYMGKTLDMKTMTMGEGIDIYYFTEMFSSYPKIDRLVIDNVNKLLLFAESKKEYRIQLSRLIRYLKEKVNCSLLVCETEYDNRDKVIDTGVGESFECDGVVHLSFLEFEEKPMRTLEVYKMRYTEIEPKIPHEFIINSKKGLKLADSHFV
jgi:circadian clock protein KaiC